MNLATLITDKPLLASLSREYELLKATNGKADHPHHPVISSQSASVCCPAACTWDEIQWIMRSAAATVDYGDWITRRLQIAAAKRRRQAATAQAANFTNQQSVIADAAIPTAAIGPGIAYISGAAATKESSGLQHCQQLQPNLLR